MKEQYPVRLRITDYLKLDAPQHLDEKQMIVAEIVSKQRASNRYSWQMAFLRLFKDRALSRNRAG